MSIQGDFLHKKINGKKRFEKLFTKLHFLSLYGLNYGSAASLSDNGEIWAISFVLKHFAGEQQLVIFDVGANRGDYCELVSETVDKSGREYQLHAFEPSLENFQFLQKNVQQKNCFLNNIGLSSNSGEAQLFESSAHTLNSLYPTHKYYGVKAEIITTSIMLQTLDKYLNQKNISFIHFLKMDVEGHELEVLKGGKQALNKKQIGIIQFEFGKANVSSRVFMKDFFDLLDANYTIHRILKDGISEKLSYSEKLEVFMTTNYLAIPK